MAIYQFPVKILTDSVKQNAHWHRSVSTVSEITIYLTSRPNLVFQCITFLRLWQRLRVVYVWILYRNNWVTRCVQSRSQKKRDRFVWFIAPFVLLHCYHRSGIWENWYYVLVCQCFVRTLFTTVCNCKLQLSTCFQEHRFHLCISFAMT